MIKEYAGIIAFVAWIITCGIAFHIGGKVNESNWQTREAKLNADAAKRIKAADDRIADIEHKHAARLAQTTAEYMTEIQRNADAKNRIIADLRNNLTRLSIPAVCPSDRNTADTTATGTAGSNDSQRARLSETSAQFLVGLANDADAIVLQLSACQQIITDDRVAH